jgi:hypothetical protein
MSFHEYAEPELTKSFDNHVSKLYTSFGRIGSFLGHSSSKFDIIKMAEIGLFSKNDPVFIKIIIIIEN